MYWPMVGRIFKFFLYFAPNMEIVLNHLHWNIEPEIFSIGSFGLRYYALCWVLAFVVSYVLMLELFKKAGKSQELLDQLTVYIFLGTLIGARLGHCFFYDFDYYKDHLLEIVLPFKIENGSFLFTGFAGLASHGAAVGILTSMYLFVRKYKLDYIWLADRLVLVVPIAGAFIRLGNFFNSEMVGNPTDLPWGIVFEKLDMIPRHPGQLYEAIAYLIIFFILWAIYKRKQVLKPGSLFGIFMVLLFGARFFLEYFKLDQVDFESEMLFNMGQFLSIPFIMLGFYFIFRKNSLEKKR